MVAAVVGYFRGLLFRGEAIEVDNWRACESPEERKPLSLSIARNILGRIPSPTMETNRARVIRNCGRRSRVAGRGIIHARTGRVLSRRPGQAGPPPRVCRLSPPSPRNSPPLARIFALDSSMPARSLQSKVIRPRCQIGDLNALNRAEVVIRYRLLPAAASCRGRPPLSSARPRKAAMGGGGDVREMGYRCDAAARGQMCRGGVRESPPMCARQINRESVSERGGGREAMRSQ